MAILVRCAACGNQFHAPTPTAGHHSTCSRCGNSLSVEGQRVLDHDVFISYSSKDTAVAQSVCDLLERQEVTCWIAPRDIAAGFEYAEAIMEAIEGTGALLLIVTEGANTSRHVKREVERAASKGIPIIPFRTQDVSLSKGLEYFLAGSHWHDALSEPLDEHVTRLLPALRRLLKGRNDAYDTKTVNSPSPAIPATPTRSAPKPQSSPQVSFDANAGPVRAPAFHFGGIVPPEFFIGRDEELQQAERAMCSQNNMLLVGELRAGKTSFGKMLIHRIMSRPNNTVLGAYLNVQQWPTLTVETFFEHTILALVGEVARQVFGVKFAALSGDNPARGRADLVDNEMFKSFLEIFRFVRMRTYVQGTTAPEAFRIEEFADVSEELIRVIRACNWSNCFVFYDEANRLGREESVDMVLSHQEALSASGLTAIYAASPAMVDSQQALQDWFVHQVRLGPFCTHDEMRRLLARYYFDDSRRWQDVPASSEALENLWALSRGMPFLIQLIAGRSFDLAHRLGDSKLSARHITEAHARLLKEKPTAFTTGGD